MLDPSLRTASSSCTKKTKKTNTIITSSSVASKLIASLLKIPLAPQHYFRAFVWSSFISRRVPVPLILTKKDNFVAYKSCYWYWTCTLYYIYFEILASDWSSIELAIFMCFYVILDTLEYIFLVLFVKYSMSLFFSYFV